MIFQPLEFLRDLLQLVVRVQEVRNDQVQEVQNSFLKPLNPECHPVRKPQQKCHAYGRGSWVVGYHRGRKSSPDLTQRVQGRK